ncbi:hypothetical protein AWH62_07630 [Maricaulis sp. W15]|uniref:hypothetical protein n=1 Tax=Maricaulis sp. W15 TaxID=1772333 RepID=UPI000948A850|nr:hypothetical protein [Maricaulis sp. W15]OLF74009.1 hypothetical protein AWH62_07630 [Maricaulis sp. W15]
MKKYLIAGVAVAMAVSISACATKRYPIATPLSAAEIELMDCNDLQLEIVRTEQVQHQITETAETDWRSVAGFLGDYGIGNAMAKSEAETALSERLQSIRAAQARHGCMGQ